MDPSRSTASRYQGEPTEAPTSFGGEFCLHNWGGGVHNSETKADYNAADDEMRPLVSCCLQKRADDHDHNPGGDTLFSAQSFAKDRVRDTAEESANFHDGYNEAKDGGIGRVERGVESLLVDEAAHQANVITTRLASCMSEEAPLCSDSHAVYTDPICIKPRAVTAVTVNNKTFPLSLPIVLEFCRYLPGDNVYSITECLKGCRHGWQGNLYRYTHALPILDMLCTLSRLR